MAVTSKSIGWFGGSRGSCAGANSIAIKASASSLEKPSPEKGGAIQGIDAAQARGAMVFQAGTAQQAGALVANGGRVLNVTATGENVGAAQAAAYAAVDAIDFPTGFCRRDIGWREVAREQG